MRTDRRTEDTPWEAVDVMTNAILGWYSSDTEAYLDNPDSSTRAYFRPKRKRVKR